MIGMCICYLIRHLLDSSFLFSKFYKLVLDLFFCFPRKSNRGRKRYDLLSPIESIFILSNENDTIERKENGKKKSIKKRRERERGKKIVIQSSRCIHVASLKFSPSSFFFFLLRCTLNIRMNTVFK